MWRVILELGDTLRKSPKLEGLEQCWILLESKYNKIRDLSSYLLDLFDLHNDCSSGLLIYRDGDVMPPWGTTTSVFKDNDTIQVECAPSNYSERKLYYTLNKKRKNKFGNYEEYSMAYVYKKHRQIVIADGVNVMREHHLQRVDKEIVQCRLKSFSELAVEYYNKNSGTEFELVESLCCQSFCVKGFLYHLNFKAKPKSADSSVNLSPKLFFAEVFEILVSKVTVCCIMEPENAVSSCGICEPYDKDETKVCHPSSDVGQVCMTESGLPVARAGLSSEIAKKEAEQQFALYLNQAIEDYNKIYSRVYVSGFELVKVVSWYALPGAGEWYHLNFEVKLKNADLSDEHTPKLFFAEIFKSVDQPVVTTCRVVDDDCDHDCPSLHLYAHIYVESPTLFTTNFVLCPYAFQLFNLSLHEIRARVPHFSVVWEQASDQMIFEHNIIYICKDKSCGSCRSNGGNVVYHPSSGYRAGGVGLEV